MFVWQFTIAAKMTIQIGSKELKLAGKFSNIHPEQMFAQGSITGSNGIALSFQDIAHFYNSMASKDHQCNAASMPSNWYSINIVLMSGFDQIGT